MYKNCNRTDSRLLLDVELFDRRDTDPATEFLEQLTEKHGLSNTEVPGDSCGYLLAIFRLGLSGNLGYVDQSHIEKWFHTCKMRVDCFRHSWIGSRTLLAHFLVQILHYYNFQ